MMSIESNPVPPILILYEQFSFEGNGELLP